jgi:hypothetical protein
VPRVALVALLGLVFAVPGRASLYQPDDPMPFPVSATGVVEPLPFDEFKRRLIVVMNQFNPLPLAEGQKNTDRDGRVQRIADRKNNPRPTTLDKLALASDLLSLNLADEALTLVKPLDNPRRPDYLVSSTLAHVHAARGEWREAVDKLHSMTVFGDAEMPATVKGLTKPQRDWVVKLDRDYVSAYFSLKSKEGKIDPENEDVPALFPVAEPKKPHHPVRFVNDGGKYEPGTIAATEKAKLPPDAIAVAQQMALWFPGDAGLYWLLAELYAADGQLDEARKILDECVDTRKYSGRRLLMHHRAGVMAAVEQKRLDEEERRKKEFPVTLRQIAIYFGVVAVVGVWAAVRAVRRRRAA